MMVGKRGIQLLAVGAIGLLLGVAIGSQLGPGQTTVGLTLYAGNADATDIEPQFTVTLPPDLTQAEALELLTTLISRYNFCHLPIAVVGIENEIATINLAEHPWNQETTAPPTLPGCSGATWRTLYFQGSAGGSITSKTLAHTLLQPDFTADWIEGVTFQYEGEPIEEGDWDHISLFGIITQENLP
jgi:hypothetical protein